MTNSSSLKKKIKKFVRENSDVSHTGPVLLATRVLISFVAYFDMVLTNNHFFPVTKAYNHSLFPTLSPSV